MWLKIEYKLNIIYCPINYVPCLRYLFPVIYCLLIKRANLKNLNLDPTKIKKQLLLISEKKYIKFLQQL